MARMIPPIITVSLVLALALSGCSIFQQTPSPVPPTPTICFYTQNPGPPPTEVEQRAQDAFFAMGVEGIRGTLKVEADGEYSCNQFLVEFVSFQYTVYVKDLADQTMIRELVAKIQDSAKASVQGWNLGHITIRLVAGEVCVWDDTQNTCGPIEPLMYP